MRPIKAARPAPAATGREPRRTDRHSGAIDSQNNITQHPAPTAAAFGDRDWWRAEARRVGSDWSGVLALHAAVVAAWRRRHDRDYGGAP
jgi:hypothetical protein